VSGFFLPGALLAIAFGAAICLSIH